MSTPLPSRAMPSSPAQPLPLRRARSSAILRAGTFVMVTTTLRSPQGNSPGAFFVGVLDDCLSYILCCILLGIHALWEMLLTPAPGDNPMWDQDKAVEVVIYLADRVRDPTKLQIFKLLYLADKLHLSRYGRFIIRDQYVAMKHGPVPSRTYDLVKRLGESADDPLEVGADNRTIVARREADLNKLSQSDRECLDEVLTTYGHVSITHLVKVAHDDLWHDLTNNGTTFDDPSAPQSIRMTLEDIADMLPNSDDVKAYLVEQGLIPTA